MTAAQPLRNWREVLAHVSDNGRKLGKTKLFTDIGAGRLRKQPDGSFRLRDVERYMAGLPMAGTPDSVAVTLASGLKTAFEAQGLNLVATAGGDARKTPALVERLESILNEALNEYSREVQFEVTFEDVPDDSGGPGGAA